MSAARREPDHIADARMVLEAEGWVVVRERTYRHLQERVRATEQRCGFEREAAASTHAWAVAALAEQRRLTDRLNQVVAAAAAAGVELFPLPGDRVVQVVTEWIANPYDGVHENPVLDTARLAADVRWAVDHG